MTLIDSIDSIDIASGITIATGIDAVSITVAVDQINASSRRRR